MKDKLGLYYYPFPGNRKVRMYVRSAGDEPEFRLWNQDDPEMWQAHGWVPYSAVIQASAMYTGGPFNPDKAYDLAAAKALIADES